MQRIPMSTSLSFRTFVLFRYEPWAKMERLRARSLSLALIALRIAEVALLQRSSSVFPGGFAHSLNCASQSRGTTYLLSSLVHCSEWPRVQPPRGCRSETKREPRRFKDDASLNWSLDNVVGCNDLLGAQFAFHSCSSFVNSSVIYQTPSV